MNQVAAFAAGIALGVPLNWMAVQIGARLRLLDLPTEIKTHVRPIPYTGGMALCATLVVGGVLFALPPWLLIGAVAMWLVGFLDDVRGLGPRSKLLAQVIPLLVGILDVQLEAPLRVTAVVVGIILVNAFNVIDGLDGLAGGVAVLSLLVVVLGREHASVVTGAVALGSLIAFLAFNLHPARLFLGDEGSLMLGYLLWILPLRQYAPHLEAREVAAWILMWSFPVANSAFVVFRRLLEGRSVLKGDRDHLYDTLNARLGLARTLVICWGIAAFGAVVAAAVAR